MRRSELIRRLERVPSPPHPRADLEQLMTPSENAADLLLGALGAGDLEGRSVLDLGAGTGRLAIGAALLGATSVTALELDPRSIEVGRVAAEGTFVEFVKGNVTGWLRSAELVVMNPPFGAQRRHADRPFWDTAFRVGRRAVYAFTLAESRGFVAAAAARAGAEVVAARPVVWDLKRTLPHHTRRSVPLAVDRWEIRTH